MTLNVNLDPDTIKIMIFLALMISLLFIFAVLNSSYKDTENVSNTPEWGGQLLIILFIIAFGGLIYKYNSLYLFIAIIVLISILII